MIRAFGLLGLVLIFTLGLVGCREKQPTIKGPLDPNLRVVPFNDPNKRPQPNPPSPEPSEKKQA